jgi:hypothetical protein
LPKMARRGARSISVGCSVSRPRQCTACGERFSNEDDYIAVCFVPDAEAQGAPHAALGMVKGFSVR